MVETQPILFKYCYCAVSVHEWVVWSFVALWCNSSFEASREMVPGIIQVDHFAVCVCATQQTRRTFEFTGCSQLQKTRHEYRIITVYLMMPSVLDFCSQSLALVGPTRIVYSYKGAVLDFTHLIDSYSASRKKVIGEPLVKNSTAVVMI